MADVASVRGRFARAAVAASIALATVPALASCMSQSCVSWADFSNPTVAYNEATVVFVGTVEGRSGTVGSEFGSARAYSVAVERVIKGRLSGSRVQVAAVPDSCGPKGGYAPGDDQLKGAGRVLVYGTTTHGPLTPLAPGQGVVEFPVGSPLPFKR